MSKPDDPRAVSVSASPVSGAPEEGRSARPDDAAPAARYTPGGLLGRGGMGEVHVAFDPVLQREVAFKVPRDPRHAAALLNEARLAARLDHPAILPIFDAGLTPTGERYYAMRIVTGDDLGQRLATTPPGRARLTLVRALLRAMHGVAHAHARGVVHRDLSPRNVRLGDHDEVLVIDWGLAAEVQAAATGNPCGTPGFQAPELVARGVASPASDVWSLGALLVEVLAGPRASLDAAAPSWVPRSLWAIARHALEPLPERRYPTAAALAADVEAFLEGRTVSVHAERPWERVARLARRNPQLAVAVVVGSVAVSVVGAGFGIVATRARDEATRAQHGLEEVVVRLETERAQSALRVDRREDAERSAHDVLALRDSAQARGVLAGFSRAARVAVAPAPDERGCSALSFERDGSQLCRRGEDVVRLSPGHEGVVVGDARVVKRALVLPSGHSLLLTEGDGHTFTLHVHDATGALQREERAPYGGLPTIAVASRGVLLGFADGLMQLDDTGHLVTAAPECPTGVPTKAVAFDGDTGLLLCGDETVRRLTPGAPPIAMPWALRGATAISVPAPGLLFVGTVEGRLGVVDLESGALRNISEGHVGPIRSVEPLDATRFLVVGETGVGVWRWASAGWLHVVERPAAMRALAKGAQVLTWHEREHEVWTLPMEGAVNVLHAAGGVSALALSADGKTLAVGAGDGSVLLVEPATGIVRTHGGEAKVIKALTFSRDGTELLVGAAGPHGLERLRVTDLSVLETSDSFRARYVGFGPDDAPFAFNWGSGAVLGAHFSEWTPALSGAVADVVTLPSQRMAFVMSEGGALQELKPGGVLEQVRAAPRETTTLALATDGTALVLAGPHTAELRRLPSHTTERTFTFEGAPVEAVAVGPRAELLAVGHRDGTLEVLDASAQRKLSVRAFTQRISAVVFAPDGSWVAAASWDGSVRFFAL